MVDTCKKAIKEEHVAGPRLILWVGVEGPTLAHLASCESYVSGDKTRAELTITSNQSNMSLPTRSLFFQQNKYTHTQYITPFVRLAVIMLLYTHIPTRSYYFVDHPFLLIFFKNFK